MDDFGTRLKRLRRENDVTQAALAEYIGVVASAVGKYETVDNAYPSVEALIKIAEFFHVSIDFLLLGVTPDAKQSGRLRLLNFAVELEERSKAE